ncbi:helix-hairpin-helix domain-containing protein [Salinigranum rubrum]|uniref:helix-hairpin-helix domain-containing protein n=1 Tax=Salinigranum rubrum TaxID=755307 RepID=UPI0013A55B66|nr:helix-hairpin-helix domain-containing protein [Salinigranum rubrum]
MRVVLTDGTEFSCENFKALESGVLLTKDKKRKKVIGFVPIHQLRYVVPEDLEPVETPSSAEGQRGGVGTGAPDGAVPETGDLTVGPPASSAQPVESAGDVTEFEMPEEESDLRRLGGLGSTYAERLQTAGYETLADLAAADPVTVAEAASVAPGRGRRWVNAARRAVSGEGQSDDGESEVDSDAADEASDGDSDDGDDENKDEGASEDGAGGDESERGNDDEDAEE